MPDKRLIDANALLETHRCRLAQNTIKVENGDMTKPYSNFEAAIMECLAEYLSSAPTIDAVEVVHARWVHDDLGHTYCSKCHERLPYIHCYSEEPCSDYDEEWDEEMPESMYCPHCGAKMDGGAEC